MNVSVSMSGVCMRPMSSEETISVYPRIRDSIMGNEKKIKMPRQYVFDIGLLGADNMGDQHCFAFHLFTVILRQRQSTASIESGENVNCILL